MPKFISRLILLGPCANYKLGWKGQGLDAQPLGIAQQAIEINTQRVGGQLGIQPSTQPPKAVGVVGLDLELLGQLSIHRFDDLADLVDQPSHLARHLRFLIASG